MMTCDLPSTPYRQGSTYLRVTDSLMALFINAEFFVTHFVYFPALQFLTTLGVFGGSNAVWRVATLRAYEFRSDVQVAFTTSRPQVALPLLVCSSTGDHNNTTATIPEGSLTSALGQL